MSVERFSPRGAVFLSYASQDAAAAGNLADALRASGIEVWFDQSELVGGDAWDAKIRQQIAECTFFMPVISAATQARREGYFRLEWNLADERTHLMAEATPFILPVAIDNTKEREALVPKSFLRVQWTRLRAGDNPATFVQRVRQLLNGDPRAAAAKRVVPETRVADPVRRNGSGVRAAAIISLVCAIIVGAYFATRRSESSPPSTSSNANSKAETQNFKPAAVPSDKSIAVLPFVNLSEDKDSGFFADGVQEDILTNLALVRELRVVSRTSVAQYRDTKKTMRDIGRELGVAYVLEGSVRRASGQVRVNAQLIRAATDEHVWAKGYDRELKEVFAIQSALATEIARALHAAVSPQEQKLIARRPTENAAAYELYLKARRIRDSGANTRSMVEQQIALLDAAVVLDPDFALAWGDLAWCQGWMYSFRGSDRTPPRLKKATHAINAAVRLAADAPETRLNRGYFYVFTEEDFPRALQEFKVLLATNPNNTPARFALGLTYAYSRNRKDALANKLLAAEQDPANGDYASQAALEAWSARRYDEAAALHRRLAQMNPESPWPRLSIAWLEFDRRGSTLEVDQFFAGLPASELNSSRGLMRRKEWALTRGNAAEAMKLDRAEPRKQEETGIGSASLADATDAIRMGAAIVSNGDRARAAARIEPSRRVLQTLLQLEPGNETALGQSTMAEALGRSAMMEALLGNKSEALSLAHRAAAKHGGLYIGLHPLAFVLAWTGDKEAAIAEYARKIQMSGGVSSRLNVHAMRHDPMFHPLQGDPRFEALLNDPKNNAPLF